MRLSVIFFMGAFSTAVGARNHDIAVDLASAGYAPGMAREINILTQAAAVPGTTRNVSFEVTRQITSDLAAAGYGPAGVIPAAAVPHARLLRPPVEHRTADAIRADLTAAGYAPVIGTKAITVGVKP